MKQLFIGLIAEGTTDVRFLKHVIYRSIVELSFRCETEIDVFDIQEVEAEGAQHVGWFEGASGAGGARGGADSLGIEQ